MVTESWLTPNSQQQKSIRTPSLAYDQHAKGQYFWAILCRQFISSLCQAAQEGGCICPTEPAVTLSGRTSCDHLFYECLTNSMVYSSGTVLLKPSYTSVFVAQLLPTFTLDEKQICHYCDAFPGASIPE